MKLAIILPAYNEALVIGSVVKTIPKKIAGIDDIQILVVDDRSTDHTAITAKMAGAKVLLHRLNLGAGGATLTGLKYAHRNRFDIAVTMDADGQHHPSDIEALVRKVLDGHDFVIGSRLAGPRRREMPIIKLFGNHFFNLITFLFYQVWVTDSQSGFRAFSKKAIEKCRIQSSGYEVCSEMIGRARSEKLKISEVPIQTIYTSYSKGKGQHYLNGFNIIIRLTLSKLRGNA